VSEVEDEEYWWMAALYRAVSVLLLNRCGGFFIFIFYFPFPAELVSEEHEEFNDGPICHVRGHGRGLDRANGHGRGRGHDRDDDGNGASHHAAG